MSGRVVLGSNRCYCSNITVAGIAKENGFLITDDIIALKESAEAEVGACTLCQLFWEAMKQKWPSEIDFWLKTNHEYRGAVDKKTAPTANGWESGIRVESQLKFDVSNVLDRQQPNDGQIVVKPYTIDVEYTTGSLLALRPERKERQIMPPMLGVFALANSEAAGLIRERSSASNAPDNVQTYLQELATWVHECSTYHDLCSAVDGEEESFLPLRVMDVSNPGNPRLLIATDSVPNSGKFMALSYCWGAPGVDTLKLTQENLQDLVDGTFREDMFTRSHQDAFILARSLNIPYVWIDALCIIQGDRKDWLAQSEKMGEIYGNSYLTIVAGSSQDARNGFLGDRTMQVPPCPIPLDSGNSAPFLYASLLPSTDEGYTSSRGWCFQESMLSKRSVVFGVEQISYRCPAGTVYEFFAQRDVTMQAGKHFLNSLPIFQPKVQLRTMDQEQKHYAVLQHWYMMLREFSGRSLTNPSDIFPSISSLAQRVAGYLHVKQQMYIAGLWETDIARGLLWRSRYSGDSASYSIRPLCSMQRAPTWSWAAVHGQIDHLDIDKYRSSGHYDNSTTSNWTPDGKWLQNSVFNTMPDFVSIKPAFKTPGSSEKAWFPALDERIELLRPTIKELWITGKLTKAIYSEEVVNSRRWKPRNDWRPEEQRGEQNQYNGRRHIFESTLMNYVHGRYLVASENCDKRFGIGMFDVEDEQCEEVWCLQITEVEGLMLRAVDVVECGDELDGDIIGRFERLGLFWIEDQEFFKHISETQLILV